MLENEDVTTPSDDVLDHNEEVKEDDLLGESAGDSDEEKAPEEEIEDIEIDGKKFQLPKSSAETLKKERLMHADYTRKTQDAAEERRHLEAERNEFVNQRQMHLEEMQTVGRLVNIQDSLAEYEQVDWNALTSQDPATASKLWINFSQLKDMQGRLSSDLAMRQQQRALKEQQETARHFEQSQAVLSKDIKDWSPDLQSKLRDFAYQEGWSDREISNITVAQIKTLHARYTGHNLINNELKKTPKLEAVPVKKVGGNASVKKSPNEMSDAEFAQWRNNTMKRK